MTGSVQDNNKCLEAVQDVTAGSRAHKPNAHGDRKGVGRQAKYACVDDLDLPTMFLDMKDFR